VCLLVLIAAPLFYCVFTYLFIQERVPACVLIAATLDLKKNLLVLIAAALGHNFPCTNSQKSFTYYIYYFKSLYKGRLRI
jgi:hypothetical protein